MAGGQLGNLHPFLHTDESLIHFRSWVEVASSIKICSGKIFASYSIFAPPNTAFLDRGLSPEV